jgi:hypothetical protein
LNARQALLRDLGASRVIKENRGGIQGWVLGADLVDIKWHKLLLLSLFL